ncbi:MAG: Hsp20/alpha crystallin family protein [Clostridiales bacterium]|nr:Hsp20/alpha crystallin family protein [Clostridiales bacterium]
MLLSHVYSDLFDDMFYGMPRFVERNEKMPMKCDAHEFDDHYELDLELPGYKKENIHAELKDGYLTVAAERKNDSEEKDEKGRVIRRERFSGECRRSFYVGDAVTEEDIKAAYTDGILKVTVPKKIKQPEIEEPHRILIA